MSFVFRCPHCGTKLEAQDEWDGLECVCPTCQNNIRIMKASEPVSSEILSAQTVHEDKSQVDADSPTKPSIPSKILSMIHLSKRGMIFGAVWSGVVFLIGILLGSVFSTNSGNTLPENNGSANRGSIFSTSPKITLPAGSPSELLLKYSELGEITYVAEVLRQNPQFDVNRPRAQGNKTALYLACQNGYKDIVELLLKYKANPAICDDIKNGKYSALTIAASKGYVDILQVLLKSGVDIDATDEEQRTALYSAAANNQPETVKFLGEANAKINIYGKNGNTPLSAAADSGYTEVVKILCEAGANVNQHDRHGYLPLHQVAYSGYTEVVKILCEAGAAVNQYDGHGDLPLHLAARKGHKDIVKVLMQYGADPYMEDHAINWNAFKRARIGGHPEIIDILNNPPPKIKRKNSVKNNQQSQKVISIHNFVMQCINERQQISKKERKQNSLPDWISTRNKIYNYLMSSEAPQDYKDAVIGMLDRQITLLKETFATTQSPQYANVSREQRVAFTVKFLEELKKTYDDFNLVCRKYGLKEIDMESGTFK